MACRATSRTRGPAIAAPAGVSSGSKALVITVRAKPLSPVSSLALEDDGVWVARLRSAPVDGKANAELVDLVARHFGCAKSSVAVVSGGSARLKRVKISAKNIEPRHGKNGP